MVQSNNHAAEIVRGEPLESMVNKNLTGFLRIIDMPDEVNSFLVRANIPQLQGMLVNRCYFSM